MCPSANNFSLLLSRSEPLFKLLAFPSIASVTIVIVFISVAVCIEVTATRAALIVTLQRGLHLHVVWVLHSRLCTLCLVVLHEHLLGVILICSSIFLLHTEWNFFLFLTMVFVLNFVLEPTLSYRIGRRMSKMSSCRKLSDLLLVHLDIFFAFSGRQGIIQLPS